MRSPAFIAALLTSWCATAQTPNPPDLVVSASRGHAGGATDPLLELSPAELESYGVDSLADLVDALRPMTRSSRSDSQPVVLINGHLAGQVEFDNLPREAIERVEVLPESVALQYGFSENQRVLNFILKEHYRATTARATESAPTDGGYSSTALEASPVSLEDEARGTLLAAFRRNAWLRESDRDIGLPDSYDRTLLPAKSYAKIAGTLSHPLFGVSASLEGSLELNSSKSLQGVSDFDRVLDQTTHENTGRLAGQLTGKLGRFVWGATLSYINIRSRSASETGVGAADETLFDLTRASLNAGNLQLSFSGPLASLPAGLMVANAKFGLQYQGFSTEERPPGALQAQSNLVRSVRTVSFNTSIPIASREHGSLPALGELAATLNVALDNVSSFGSLYSSSYGLDWIPVQKVHVSAIFTDHEAAPTVQQVLSPPIFTPNAEVYDFVRGETVRVTTITGGGGTLSKSDDRVQSFGLSLGPFGKTSLSAHYERHRTRDGVGPLPPLTDEVETAFPERFLRDADGNLIEVDNRWINLARQSVDDLKWGAVYWLPLGAAATRSQPNRIELSLFDTWYLRDTTLVRNGVPPLDLLNGSPSDENGGQSRHKVEWRSLIFKNGIGFALNVGWSSATTVGGADTASALHFSALGTADARVFGDLERVPALKGADWAKGLRLSLAVINLFDRRQSVRDETGATPVAFEPGYVDPAGRTLWFSVRKVL